jgi:hypothetical protein
VEDFSIVICAKRRCKFTEIELRNRKRPCHNSLG